MSNRILNICSFVLAIIVLLLLKPFPIFSQNSVGTSLQKKEIKIGEQTTFQFSLLVPSGAKVVFPALADSIAPSLEIVSVSKIDTQKVNDNNQWRLSQSYIITSFDSGYFPIPAFKFTVNGDTTWESSADLLSVKTVPVDTTKAFKPIKEPLDAPWTIAEIYKEIAIAAAILLAVILLVFWLKKRKPKAILPERKIEPQIPAHLIAIDALNELKEQQLWQKGSIKFYHVRLSEIVRVYLQNRFDFHALEKTTDEIAFSLSSLMVSSAEKNSLLESLRISDLVKFAKANPLASDHEFCWNAAWQFVQCTIPETKSKGGESNE